MYTQTNKNSVLLLVKASIIGAAIIGLSGCFDSDSDKEKLNTAPNATSINVITQTETALTEKLPASDVDYDVLAFAVSTEPSKGTVTLNADGTFTYSPMAEFTGSDTFSFTATDPEGLSATGSVGITIEALQVQFTQFARDAFAADATSAPVSVNGREFVQDGIDATDYQDLIDN